MRRQPRLDAPGALHHVTGRGIERTQIFTNDGDRADFLGRLAEVCRARALIVSAWALCRTTFTCWPAPGGQPLPQSMKKLLTAYVANFNRAKRATLSRFRHLQQLQRHAFRAP
jgi:REP element-mobilizing transposase RayT